MSRFAGLVVAALIAVGHLLYGSASAAPDGRVALVIGNGKYQNVAELPNPASDAQAVAAALKRIGFSVVEGYDLGFTAMAERLKAFGKAADKASVAMVY